MARPASEIILGWFVVDVMTDVLTSFFDCCGSFELIEHAAAGVPNRVPQWLWVYEGFYLLVNSSVIMHAPYLFAKVSRLVHGSCTYRKAGQECLYG